MKPVPGLHRVPGDTRVVAECASRYDEREAAPLRGVRDARAVASVLKLYLDALPTPLLRAANGLGANAAGPASIAEIAKTRRERGRDAALAALRAFVATRLPARNRDALRATCAHLGRVARAEANAFSSAEAPETLAASYGKTLCGESLGASEAGSVVELLVKHLDSVFGTSRSHAAATARRSPTRDDKENDDVVCVESTLDVVNSCGERRDAEDVARVATRNVASTEETDCLVSRLDGVSLELVRAFFDGDDGVCAEADRALGGSLCSLYASAAEEVEAMPVEALRREKTAVKRRLRAFDVSVERTSGARSTKEDKKHLRPLYLRLARVKRRMQIEHIAEVASRA